MKTIRILLVSLLVLSTPSCVSLAANLTADDGNLIESPDFENASICEGKEFAKLSIQKENPVPSDNSIKSGQCLKIEMSGGNGKARFSIGGRTWIDPDKMYRLSYKMFAGKAMSLNLSSYAYNSEKTASQPLFHGEAEKKSHWILSLDFKGPTHNWETKEVALGPVNSGSEVEFFPEMDWMNLGFTANGTGTLYLADLEIREMDADFNLVENKKIELRKSTAMIPELNWEKRSDWIDVKTDVTPAAKGDGAADDTEALQAALDKANKAMYGTSIYFPPGTYRITKTLVLGKKEGRLQGILLVGHGRSTVFEWDGEENGRMLWSIGAANSRYVGIVWDGRGKAAVGIDHAADFFETELRHQHEAFLNFTEAGIRIGKGPLQSAGIIYDNCLFERCKTGVALLAPNDYNNTFDGCEFRECGQGIVVSHANAYIRNCHFELSSTCDISLGGEHCSSVRRCTSVGSKRFLAHQEGFAALTIQDCRVDGWKTTAGAIVLKGAPVIIMDCVFTHPPYGTPPVQGYYASQRIIHSNNKAIGSVHNQLFQNPNPALGMLYEVPAGKLGGTVKSPTQSFLKSQARIPGKVFDVKRDFGAAGDGVKDDTEAIKRAIEAARAHGKGAVAYLPSGRYIVTETLEVGGANHYVGGSGFCSALIWKGKAGGTTVHIGDPNGVTLENMAVGFHDYGKTENEADIIQTGSGKQSSMFYDHVYVYGMCQKQPLRQGLRFVNMGKQDIVLMRHVNGNLRFIDSAQAAFLVNESYEGTVVLEGKNKKSRDGFLGFLTRLTTVSSPALIVKDNHSIVMSDFHVEQADSYIRLEGGEEARPGQITIQGAKIGLLPVNKDNVLIDIDNYQGEFTLGHNQFSPSVPMAKIYGKGDRPLGLVFVGNFFCKSKPDVKLGPASKLTYFGNQGIGEVVEKDKDGKESRKQGPMEDVNDTKGVDPMPQLMRAFDDLRRLGELDLRLNHPESAAFENTKEDMQLMQKRENIKRKAKDTLCALEMNRGEIVEFELASGKIVRIELVSTQARVLRTTLKKLKVEENNARTIYSFNCVLKINGREHALEREVGTQRSFYEPWEIDGLRIWFDAVQEIYDFLVEHDFGGRPRKNARFAFQDATLRICPGTIYPWCQLPEGGLRIEHCWRGEDCWLGAYNGAVAHGGLDINHPKGTPLWAPLDIHDNYYFNSLAMGDNNNRWRGIHVWPNGAKWILQAHHMTELTVKEHAPIKKGQQFAWGAGVLSGGVDHSHFIFKIQDYGRTILLDPWILFWQMYKDQKAGP